MKTPRVRHRRLAWLGFVLLAVVALLSTPTRGDDPPAAATESFERPGQSRLDGQLLAMPSGSLGFRPRGEAARPVPLAPGSEVVFQRKEPLSTAIPPLFVAQVGELARLSGNLRTMDQKSLVLDVPWQSAEVTIARPGIQALVQRPGEAGLFVDGFEKLDSTRWTVEGKVELAPAGKEPDARRGLSLAAAGGTISHRLAEPLGSGRLELAFHDDGQVVPGRRWILELSFRGPAGPTNLRVVFGWAEESLAVESPDGPSLAVQRLAREAGWHRLILRFGPEQTEISVDGNELAHGRGTAGPLQSIAIAAGAGAGGTVTPPSGLAARVSEMQLVRFAEPPASVEVDPSQDEVRLVVGDQFFGRIRRADADGVAIEVAGKPVALAWSEVAGVQFRREPVAARPIEGTWVRAEWRASPGDPAREPNFAEGVVRGLSAASLTLETPYCGTLSIPRARLVRLRVLEPGWRQVLDPAAHHLGDEVKGPPATLDPPVPEGGVLERTFDLEQVGPGDLFLSLDVRDVVGETGSPFSALVQKGEIRTHVALNGRRIDSLNKYITTANQTPERIRIPLPAGLLKVGRNVLRIEQTGTAQDPTAFDDLEVLQVAIQRPAANPAASPAPEATGTAPPP